MLRFTGLDDISLPPLAQQFPPCLQSLTLDISGCHVTDRGVVLKREHRRKRVTRVLCTEGVLAFLKKLSPDLSEATIKMQHSNVSKGTRAAELAKHF